MIGIVASCPLILLHHIEMPLTRERKIFLALGAAAGIALVGDRLFLGATVTGPSSASAGTFTTPAPAPARPNPRFNDPHIANPASTLAQRIRNIAATNEAEKDAFKPSEKWLEQSIPDKPHHASQADPSNFLRQHRLEAVVPNISRGYAMVDGAPLFVGQKLEGFTLVAVRNRSAVFEMNGSNIELHMDEGDMRP
jgi:hypothetical protein